jgi:hypothetical protein
MICRDLKPGNIAAKIQDATLESLNVVDLGQMIKVGEPVPPHVFHNDQRLCQSLKEVGAFYPQLAADTPITLPKQGFDILMTFKYLFCVWLSDMYMSYFIVLGFIMTFLQTGMKKTNRCDLELQDSVRLIFFSVCKS